MIDALPAACSLRGVRRKNTPSGALPSCSPATRTGRGTDFVNKDAKLKTTDQRLDISGREERKIAKVIRGPSVPLPLDHGILNLSNPGAAYQESAGRSSLSNAYVLVEKHKRPTFYIRPQKLIISLTSRSVLRCLFVL